MKGVNSFVFSVASLLALEMAIIITSCSAASNYQSPGSKWQVTIENLMKDSTLVAHCQSKDDDLGEHIIGYGGQYYWKFKMNIWQTTRFWCRFGSSHGQATFDVFWPEQSRWLSERCNYENCKWVAQDEGFYLENTPKQGILEFMHGWEAGGA